ncbi:MAG TPA: OstA-like protein [Sediminibacterium sp.]|nr:OstA-like protein [Sediminibacterium sp.]
MAQRNPVDTVVPGKQIDILKADRYNAVKVDSATNLISLGGNVLVKQENTLFYADSIVINSLLNTLEAFGNVHINDADSVHTYAQYLKYQGKEKKALLQKKVKLTDGKAVLTTDDLDYDVTLKIGVYRNGGKVVDKKTVLTSKEGYYYGDTKDVIFKQKVRLVDPEYKINTDTLQYNTNTDIATFTCPTVILNEKRTIKTKDGWFDIKNKKGVLRQRSVIDDSTYTFTADDMAFDDSTGMSEFTGNAVYRGKDSTEGYDLIANNIKTNKKKSAFLATQKPLLLIKQNKDSIYVSADTLYSARLSDLIKTRKIPVIRDSTMHKPVIKTGPDKEKQDSSNDKFIEAFYHVRIFSDSLQAVGDSLFYSMEDSTFRLFKEPVAWAQSNQISGDTLYLFLANKKPERLYVFENAMALNLADSSSKDYYNQLKGNSINALFNDGQINLMLAKGSAENVYYGLDDFKRFTGVNKSEADIIEISFEDNKPQKVVFRNNLIGNSYPMRQVNHEDLKLRNFKWQDDRRPKSKFQMLSYDN